MTKQRDYIGLSEAEALKYFGLKATPRVTATINLLGNGVKIAKSGKSIILNSVTLEGMIPGTNRPFSMRFPVLTAPTAEDLKAIPHTPQLGAAPRTAKGAPRSVGASFVDMTGQEEAE